MNYRCAGTVEPETASDRVMVILGAGASADAGLHLTAELAEAIVKEANKHRGLLGSDRDWIQALNAVYSGMVNYQTIHGENPLTSVNIEMLISAIRLLSERDSLEISPFVGSWSPGISNFNSTSLPGKTVDQLLSALGNALVDTGHRVTERLNVSRLLIDIIHSATNPDLKKPLEEAEHFVLTTLVKILGQHGNVEYLQPLIDLAKDQPNGLDVLTLNYDLTVESAANGQVRLWRGVESWGPGQQIGFPPENNTLNLIKLHGSLDWQLRGVGIADDIRLTGRGIRVVPEDEMNNPDFQDREPWIVVGTRDKLGTDGPTLELNFAARSAFRRASRLVIVGYSFNDKHVNNMIRDWLSYDAGNTISVVDKSWPLYRYRYENPEDGTFRNALLNEYAKIEDDEGVTLAPRMHVFQGTAAEKLHEAIATPVKENGRVLEILAQRNSDSIRLDIISGKWSMTDVHIWTSPIPPREGECRAENVALHWKYPRVKDDSEFSSRPALDIPEWSAGETVTAYMSPQARGVFQIVVQGSSIVGSMQKVIEMEATDEDIKILT